MVLSMLIFLFIFQSAGVWFILYFWPDKSLIYYLLWGSCWATLPIVVIADPSRYVVWYRFSQDGIEYHTLFRRKKMLPYSNYPYVLHGKYLHGVYWRHYIIFTDRRIKNAELSQINHVAPSDQLIKVQYSKKVLVSLVAVLPEKPRASLTAIRWEDEG